MYYHSTDIVEKKQRGQYFTHPDIALQIVQETCGDLISKQFWEPFFESNGSSQLQDLLDKALSLRILDPSMGDGIFIVNVLHFYEDFIKELWKRTHSTSKFIEVNDYFKSKIGLDFRSIGENNPTALDIWKLFVLRSMIYGVDLDSKIVKQTYDKLLTEFSTLEAKNLAKYLLKLNLKKGNSLLSPIRMQREVQQQFYEEYSVEITEIIKTRRFLQRNVLSTFSEIEIGKKLKVCNSIKAKIIDKLTDRMTQSSVLSFLSSTNYFLWELEFPEVFFSKKSGFDIVLGNPPWEKWKLYNREWLGTTALGNPTIITDQVKSILTNSQAHKKYQRLKEFYSCSAYYFNKYYRWQPGEKNLYRLFLERFYCLCSFEGYIGIILPGGLLGEYFSEPLRHLLLTKTRISVIKEIVSNQEMFADVEPGLSILIIIAQKFDPSDSFLFIKGINTLETLTKLNTKALGYSNTRCVHLDRKNILNSSPRYIIPAVRSQKELDVVNKIIQNPTLSSVLWGCKTSRGIDMTNDRHLLVTHETDYPLIEGRHLVRLGYDTTIPRYWVRSFKEYTKRSLFWDQNIIVWKNFSGNHRRRRMRIAVLPPRSVISNSVICLYNLPKVKNVEFYLAGIMCSIPFEFRIRQLCYGLNINQYVIDSITVPLYNPKNEIHQRIASVVQKFLPKGKEWARKKMLTSSSKAKSELEYKYLDTITLIDSLSALVYQLSQKEFEITLNAHKKLESFYKEKALEHFISENSFY